MTEQEAKDHSSPIILTITDASGNEKNMTAAEVLEAAGKSTSEKDKYVNESISFVRVVHEGLAEIDVHPKDPYGVFGNIELAGYGEKAAIRPGRYFILTDKWIDENRTGGIDDSELEALKAGDRNGLVLVDDLNQIADEGIGACPVTIQATDEDGNAVENPPYEPFDLYILTEPGTEKYVTVNDLVSSLYAMGIVNLAVRNFEKSAGKEQAITKFDSNSPLIVKNGKLFTQAMRGKKKNANDIWPIGNDFRAEVGEMQMTASDEKALDVAIGSNKTMTYLNAAATATDYRYEADRVCIVEASISDLLEKRKLKDTKKNKAKIRNEINAISRTSWTLRQADTGEFLTIPLAGGKCWAKGDVIHFTFSPDFMGAVLNREAGRMTVDPILLGTDDVKCPHAFTIGWKLSTHSYQNLGKKNETTLSVSKLLDFVEGIPSFETVKDSNRAYTQRIIEPMEKSLYHLVEIGFLEYWDYCHKNGEPLADEEQGQRFADTGEECALPYDIAKDANIQWQFSKAYKEQRKQTMKARESKAMKAEDAKRRKAEKEKRIERKVESNIARAKARKALEESDE